MDQNKEITKLLISKKKEELCTVLGFPIRDIEPVAFNTWMVTYHDGSKASVDGLGVSSIKGFRSIKVRSKELKPKLFNDVKEVVQFVSDLRSANALSVSMFDFSKELNGGRNQTIFTNIKKGVATTMFPLMIQNLQRMFSAYGYSVDLSKFEKAPQRRQRKPSPPTDFTKPDLRSLPKNNYPFTEGPCCPFTLYGSDYNEQKYI